MPDLYILYLRKSREDIEREHKTGEDVLQTHRERLVELAKVREYSYWEEHAEVESGDTISGRPVFRRLIELEIPKGKYRGIIINEISRLGRGDMEDAGRIYKTLTKYNLLIITPHKTYDPLNRSDLRQIRFELFLSREEFELIRERLDDGRDHKARQGYAPCYLPILGFNTLRGKFIHVPEEIALVKEIFEMRAYDRKSYAEIAEILNSRGLKTKRGTIYHQTTIRKILYNKRYIGIGRWRGELVDSKFTKVIPTELWNIVHNEVNPARAVRKRTSPESSPYFVDLYCHHCGNRMYGEWVSSRRLMRSGQKKVYDGKGIYICVGRKRPEKCRHQQRIIIVHEKVLCELMNFVESKMVLRKLALEREQKRVMELKKAEINIEEFKKKLTRIDKFLLKLDEDYRTGELPAALYGKHFEEALSQKNIIESMLKAHKNQLKEEHETLEDIDSLCDKAMEAINNWTHLSTPEQKSILSSFFPRIEIDREGVLYITRRLPSQLRLVK